MTYILGIWDGHDCGAAIVKEGEIKVAVNEERYTKRKLDVGFPTNSILACLDFLNLKPSDIDDVAVNTSDFAKTLTRAFPFLKEGYYYFRRRKIPRPLFPELRRHIKYHTTEIPELPLCKKISNYCFNKNLNKLGFKDYQLHWVDHHLCHAVAASLCSGFKKSLSITLDGVGDSLSGTINIFDKGEIKRIQEISAKDSFGIFFEQVTTLLGMRELEDEGKVMALSDFSYDIPDEDNKLLDFFEVDGLEVKCKYPAMKRYNMLKKALWRTPREDFAFMAQRTLEKHIVQLFKNAIEETGIKNVCWSGGVASNVKVNMQLRKKSGLKNWFVFPHMGDGGLAVGAALAVDLEKNGSSPKKMKDVFLGPDYDQEEIKKELHKKRNKLSYEQRKDLPQYVGELISQGKFALWYQGRMEYGPRALGNRSIVAPSFSEEVKDDLNLKIKKRSWFQPFCPSLLQEESPKVFSDADSYDKFMTMGYMTKEDIRDKVISVINVDDSARPQMLGKENPKYRKLMEEVKKNTGSGIILNTSFNLHGYPIVNTPQDAIEMMIKTKAPYLGIGNFMVELK